MARTGPRALLLQNYWENPCMRAVKSCAALLGTRTAECNAIFGHFVAFKHPSNLQPVKQMQTTY